jgi:asparagine synthase (glutamine-hydrolysing)
MRPHVEWRDWRIMAGFVVGYRPSSRPPTSLDAKSSGASDFQIDYSGDDVRRLDTNRNNTALVDGCAIGVSTEQLVAALESHDDAFLSRIHGNYCALIISPDGEMQGFCDRFGARSLYWQTTLQQQIVIASRQEILPVSGHSWDQLGLAEMLRYRWTSGPQTLVAGVSRLPHWKRVSFSRNGEICIRETSQQPRWPTQTHAASFAEKLNETRTALSDSLREAALSHDRVAIFLSGGVDSSLLAALYKTCFRHCLLVTPVFGGGNDPELEAAKSYAEKLQLEHLLVKFDPNRLDTDLCELVHAKGGQIHFHALAIHQMMAAIPSDYQLCVYGEAADGMFGSGLFKRVEHHLRIKRMAGWLPRAGVNLLSRLPLRRAQQLGHLLNKPEIDVILQSFQIQYDPRSMSLIESLYNADVADLFEHRAVRDFRSQGGGEMRRLLQDLALRCESASHFKETGISATCFGKQVFVPFLSDAVLDAAGSLTREQYYGGKFTKPILRELACEHFDRDMIYSQKRGFDVPYIAWLEGPLAHLVEAARRERQLFDGSLLEDFELTTHVSLYWSLISWQLIDAQLTS